MSQSRFIILLIAFTGPAAWAGGSQGRLNENGVALCEDRGSKSETDCYDPVSYLTEQKAVKVSPEAAKQFRSAHQGATYVFSSQAHLNLFTKNPEKYLPQYGGWCAYAVAAKKDKVDVDPKSFLVQDGRLLLFYSGFFADTRKTWQTDKSKTPEAYLKEADNNWPSVKDKEP